VIVVDFLCVWTVLQVLQGWKVLVGAVRVNTVCGACLASWKSRGVGVTKPYMVWYAINASQVWFVRLFGVGGVWCLYDKTMYGLVCYKCLAGLVRALVWSLVLVLPNDVWSGLL